MSAASAARWEGASAEAWRAAWRVPELAIRDLTASTNDEARARAEAGAPAGTTVLADAQTAGRGRHGRAWHAPPGAAVLLSMVLRPPLARAAERWTGTLPLRVGLAAARALEDVAGCAVGLKWPNDLVLDGRKLGGVLCEGALAGPTGFLVVGIGVNVRQAEHEFPPELRALATSLRLATGTDIDRAAVAGALIRRLLPLARAAPTPLEGADAEALRARDLCLGRMLRVHTRDGAGGERVLEGRGAGIQADGALRVRLPDGRCEDITAGTVRLADADRATPTRATP